MGCHRRGHGRFRRVRSESAGNCGFSRRRSDLPRDGKAHIGAYYLHAIIFFFIVGIWASSRVERLWGRDSQRIVIDEVVGQMITFGIAAGRYQLSATYIALGFGLFRLFDILKPFPIRRLEGFKGGLGVVADDVGAGLYALAVLTLVIRYVHA